MTDRVKGRVAEQWRIYREMVVPRDAGKAQLMGTEMAFYAGASSLLAVIVRVLEPGREPTEGDLRAMDEIHAELNEHAHRLMTDGPAS